MRQHYYTTKHRFQSENDTLKTNHEIFKENSEQEVHPTNIYNDNNNNNNINTTTTTNNNNYYHNDDDTNNNAINRNHNNMIISGERPREAEQGAHGGDEAEGRDPAVPAREEQGASNKK